MSPFHPTLAFLAANGPFLIPIVAIIFGCSIAMLAIYTRYRKRKDMYELYHRERMAAIDKGIELPPLPDGFFCEDGQSPMPYHPRRNLLKGLVWLFLGIGVFAALRGSGESEDAWWGVVPACIGLAYLIYYGAAGRREAELADAALRARLTETKPPGAV